MRYGHVIELALSSPWAIQPEYAAVIQDLLAYRSRGEKEDDDIVDAKVLAARGTPSGRQAAGGADDTIGVLSIVGVISSRMELVDRVSGGGVSPDRIAQSFRAMQRDPAVHSIVLDIDSPGGSVFGLTELADEIRASRGSKKPIVAVANSIAASAAYWLATQADEVVVTPSGQVGSIGVYSMHENIREYLTREGREVTLVSYGKYKVEANPFEPLSEDAKAAIKAEVDEYGAMFERAVSRGRSVPIDVVRETFGQGRMVMADDAVRRGMADRVGTFDEVVTDLARRHHARQKLAASADLAARQARTATRLAG